MMCGAFIIAVSSPTNLDELTWFLANYYTSVLRADEEPTAILIAHHFMPTELSSAQSAPS